MCKQSSGAQKISILLRVPEDHLTLVHIPLSCNILLLALVTGQNLSDMWWERVYSCIGEGVKESVKHSSLWHHSNVDVIMSPPSVLPWLNVYAMNYVMLTLALWCHFHQFYHDWLTVSSTIQPPYVHGYSCMCPSHWTAAILSIFIWGVHYVDH